MNTYKDRIMVFQQYLKKALVIMEMQKKQLKAMSDVRDKEIKAQKGLLTDLMKYEDIAVAYYSEQDYNLRTLTHPNQESLKSRIEDSTLKMKNSYMDTFIWLKGEFLDVQGMYDALQGREAVMKNQLNTESKKRDDTKEF